MGAAAGPGPGRLAAYLLGAVVAALALVGIALSIATFSGSGPGADYIKPQFFLPDLVLGLVYGPFGAYVAARTRHPVGWALAVVGLGFLVSAVAIQWVLLVHEHPGLPGEATAVALVLGGWPVGALAGLLVVPWLVGPDRPRGLGAVGVLVGALAALTAGVVRSLQVPAGAPDHPFAPVGLSDLAADIGDWDVAVYVLIGLAGAVHLVLRRRRAPEGDRRGYSWLLGAVLLVAGGYAAFEIGLRLGGLPEAAGASLLVVAQVMLLAAVFALFLREESWTVDLAVSRTIVGALLAGLVLTAYVVLVWVLGELLDWSDQSAGVVVVALLALGVAPLRRWVQRRVDELVFGTGADASQLLADLGRDLATGTADEDLLDGLAGGLTRALRLRSVEVASSDPSGPRAAAGGPAPARHTLPLLSRGRQVGVLRVAPRSGQRLDPRTVRALEEISGLVAIALELATANRALDDARRQLLDVRQEERRLLRRELHDGLGPSLSGVALALAAIANTSPLRSSDAALLDQVCAELNRRADDVRQMARVLLPPALEVGRLEDALQELATRFTDDRFTVSVDVSGADRLPPGHQVAAYHIAGEGVRNAYRHAGATRCEVALRVDPDGSARLEVSDNGTGLDPAAAPGVGLSSMRERAAELGGSFGIVSAPTGARVTVVLP